MPKTIGIAGVVVYDTNELGHATVAHSKAASLSTTASTYAVGCQLIDETTGINYYNSGTVAVPVWTPIGASPTVQMVKEVTLTAAQIIALYTTSIEVIPAVAGKAIILDDVIFDLTGTATQFTGGGVVNLQYKNTANGAGATLHADIAASVVNNATGRVITQRIAKDISATATADIVGQGVFIGAKTAVFATGTGTARVVARYHLA